MPNTWFNYGQPLFISGIFFIVGSTLFCFARGDQRRQVASAKAWGLLIMVLGGAPGLIIFLGSPSPKTRQVVWDHVFRTPPERIERFVIRGAQPNGYRPLTTADVVIDDGPRIRRIAEVLHTAYQFAPYRPRARWTADVTMITRDGTYHFTVEWTGPYGHNGTLVHLSSKPDGSGWSFGTARADGLETLLEEAVNSASAH